MNTESGPRFEPAVGRYLNLEVAGTPHRIYVEEAGQGIPLLCLHTAGSDGRQYRGLMNDDALTQRFRVIAFDLPWHGKSSPPAGWQTGAYRLTSDAYLATILAVVDALRLDRPICLGCSIGGRIVLHLALAHARRLRALVGLESAAHAHAYYDLDLVHRPGVHRGGGGRGKGSGALVPPP